MSRFLLDDHNSNRERSFCGEVSFEAGRVDDVLLRIVYEREICICMVVFPVAQDVLRKLIPKSPWSQVAPGHLCFYGDPLVLEKEVEAGMRACPGFRVPNSVIVGKLAEKAFSTLFGFVLYLTGQVCEGVGASDQIRDSCEGPSRHLVILRWRNH